MKRISRTAGALGLVGCAVMSGAFAATDDSFWYVGGNIGQSRAKIDDARIAAQLLGGGLATNSIANDDKNTAFKLLGGYQFNRNFALEAGYFDLGQFGYQATTTPAGTLNGRIKLRGVNLDAVGILPVTEKFSAFGRLGVQYAQAQDNFNSTGAVPTPTNPNPNQTALNYKTGVGLQYDLTQSLGMRAEAERYRINDAVGNKGDINMFSLGLVYRFDQRKPAPVEKVAMQEPVAAPPQMVVVVMPAPAPKKVVFSADSDADALFAFGKSDIKPTGQRVLDKFAADLKGADYDVITVTGHTDRIGSHAYNMKLSERRAEAVRDYLIAAAGIPAGKITAKGMDGAQPVTKPGECKGNKATKKLVACLAPDRRVEVEVAATRTAK
ncbi:MAG: OmpA family protein [Gallionella sp.]|nr:OmpA family protein [Gallionella sp.]